MFPQEQKERREHSRMTFNRLVLVKDDSGNTEPENKKMNLVAEVMQNFKQGDMYTTSVKFVGELALN